VQRVSLPLNTSTFHLGWGGRWTGVLPASVSAARLSAAINHLLFVHCDLDAKRGQLASNLPRLRFTFEEEANESTVAATLSRESSFCGRSALAARDETTLVLGNLHSKLHPYWCMAYRVKGTSTGSPIRAALAQGELRLHIQGIGTRGISVDPNTTGSVLLPGQIGHWPLTTDGNWHTSCLDVDLALDRAFGGQDHVLTKVSLALPFLKTAPWTVLIDEFLVRKIPRPARVLMPAAETGEQSLTSVTAAQITVGGDSGERRSSSNSSRISNSVASWDIHLTTGGCDPTRSARHFPALQVLCRSNGSAVTMATAAELVREAGAPLGGHFQLDHPPVLPIQVPALATASELRSLLKFVTMDVAVSGQHRCYERDLEITVPPAAAVLSTISAPTRCTLLDKFDDCNGACVPRGTICADVTALFNASNCNLTGQNASVQIETVSPGGFMMTQVPGAWLRHES
jgi:hypothetical protein